MMNRTTKVANKPVDHQPSRVPGRCKKEEPESVITYSLQPEQDVFIISNYRTFFTNCFAFGGWQRGKCQC